MTELASLMKRNLLSIFNQRNDQKRKAAIREMWAADGILWTADGTYIGRGNVEKAAARLLLRYPEFDFTEQGEVDEIPNAARLRWSFGAKGEPPALTGMDVIVVSDRRIVAIYRFVDGADL